MDSKRNKQSDREVDQKLDQQFVKVLTSIQSKYLMFNRHTQIRIEKWVEKLLQCDENTTWRKNRNNYINLLHQMVVNEKITSIFMKMPPEKDLPNLSENQYRRFIHQLKIVQKLPLKCSQFMIKKLQQPIGDVASQLVTPNCQTQRVDLQQKENSKEINTNFTLQQKTEKKSGRKVPIQLDGLKTMHLMEKITKIMHKHEEKLSKDSDYLQLMQKLQESCLQKRKPIDQESSCQLKVEQGIQICKANLFQFGSPRGMTQMQYFKAALQL